MDITSHHVPTGNSRVHVLEAGSGKPVLFLHGYPTNAQLWRHILPLVGQTRRGIAIDLPGFGASDVDADSSYDVTVHLDAITAALDALGVDQLGLCVHDAGGYYGLLWAVQHPERITELCILNTVASPKVSLLARATIQAYRIPLLRDLLAMPFAAKIGMQMGMSKRRLDADAMALYTTPFKDPQRRKAYVKTVGQADWECLVRVDAELKQFDSIPVRIVWGNRDRILPGVRQTIERVASHLPAADITELDGVGHFLQEDAPQEVSTLVTDFFAQTA